MTRMNPIFIAVACLSLALLVCGTPATASADEAQVKGDPYTLTTCPVSGKTLGPKAEATVRVYDGREIRFCCGGCPAKFEADQAASMEKVDKAMAEQQAAGYPLDTCVVSGEKLGSMGDPVDTVVDNRLVKLCCAGCKKSLAKHPEDFIAKLDEAVAAKQKEGYKLTACPVSGKELAADGGVNYVIANHLIRLCCDGCKKKIDEEPAKYLSMLDKGAPEKN